MKILLVLNVFWKQYGGAFGVVLNQALQLRQRGFDVFIFTTAEKKEEKEGWSEEDKIKIYRTRIKTPGYFLRNYLSLINFKRNREFKKILDIVRPDIVHFHALYYHLPLSLLKIAKKRKSKVFLTTHDVMLIHYGKLMPRGEKDIYKISFFEKVKEASRTYNPLKKILVNYYLKYVDKIFAVSSALKNLLEKNGIKNIEIIHNGIDVHYWQADAESMDKFCRKFSLYNKKIIFFGGRLSWAKGGEQLLKSLSKIKKEINNFVLLVAGEKNDYVKNLEKVSKVLELEKNIIFTGNLIGDELKTAYFCSNLVVVPSLCFDSFPTTNLEAMACKKPVVATIFGGSREVVIDNETGYLINPNNIDPMAEKILDLLKNPQKAKLFGEAGYQRVKSHFSLSKQIEEILKYYHKFYNSTD